MVRLSHLLASLAATTAAAQQVCNNAAALCDRRYDNVTYAGAHDSPFTRNATTGYSIFGDQFYDAMRILDSGPRLLSGQMHLGGDQQLHLCHTSCVFIDAGLVVDWLARLKTWLDAHPTDVVTILLVNSDNANATTLAPLWEQAGVAEYSYAPADVTRPLRQWPTLAELIRTNKRLVTFIAGIDPATTAAAPYLLDEFTFAFETAYDNVETADFSCDPDRPDAVKGDISGALTSGRMPLMNHFLYDRVGSIEFPAVEKINTTNADKGVGSLGREADNCTAAYGRAPTYYLVDFINIGPAVDTADRLNGVTGKTTGRQPLPNQPLVAPTSSAVAASSAATSAVERASTGTVPVSSSAVVGDVSSARTSPVPPTTTGGSAREAVSWTWLGACIGLGFWSAVC